MRIFKLGQPVFAAAALFAAFLAFSAPASAQANNPGQQGKVPGYQGNQGVTLGTPGPVAGTGLVGMAVVGGYFYLVWQRRRKQAQK